MTMKEKFESAFKAEKSYSVTEIVNFRNEMNKKFKEVQEFMTENSLYITWLSNQGQNYFLQNDEFTFYLNSLQVVTSGGVHLLNEMRLFYLSDGVIKIHPAILVNESNRIDWIVEHDMRLFNEWHNAVEKLLEDALKKFQ